MSKLDFLEKIANQVLDETNMNPDPAPQMSEEEVQELQTGQAPAPQALSDEEAALKQQLDAEIAQDQAAEEEERAQEHALVDRALLEGAAGEAVKEMEDEEIKDLLLDKAASEMIALGTFANLIDLATSGSENDFSKIASETLDYMSQSSEHFQEGLSKVASEMYHPDNTDQINSLFSREGIGYTFEQLAKLNDYDDLSKVANDEDVESLAVIVENEAEELLEAQEIVEEAYNEALKEIAKEDIKEAVLAEGEYDEGQAEGMLSTASIGMEGLYKEAGIGRNVLLGAGALGAGGAGVYAYNKKRKADKQRKADDRQMREELTKAKKEREAAKKGGKFGKLSKKQLLAAGGVGTTLAAGGAGVHAYRKNQKGDPVSKDAELEQLAHQFLDEVEMYKQANESTSTTTKKKKKFNMPKPTKKQLLAAGGVGTTLAAGGAGVHAYRKRKDRQNSDSVAMEQLAHQFLEEVEMYKQANEEKKFKMPDFKGGFNKAKDGIMANKGKAALGVGALGATGLGVGAYRNHKKKKANQEFEQVASIGMEGLYKEAKGLKMPDFKGGFNKAKDGVMANKGKTALGVGALGATGLGIGAYRNNKKKKANQEFEQVASIGMEGLYKQANPFKGAFGAVKEVPGNMVDGLRNMRDLPSNLNQHADLIEQQNALFKQPPPGGVRAKFDSLQDGVADLENRIRSGRNTAIGTGVGVLGAGGAAGAYGLNKRRNAGVPEEFEQEASYGMGGLYKQANPFKGALEAAKNVPGNVREGFGNMRDLPANLRHRSDLLAHEGQMLGGNGAWTELDRFKPELNDVEARIRSGRNTAIGTGVGALGAGGAGAYGLHQHRNAGVPEELVGDGMEQVASSRRYYV